MFYDIYLLFKHLFFLKNTSSAPVVNGLPERNNPPVIPTVQPTPILSTQLQPAVNMSAVPLQPSTTIGSSSENTPGEVRFLGFRT